MESLEKGVLKAFDAREFGHRLDPDDARQEGYLACLKAAPKFDPARGPAEAFFCYVARSAMRQVAKKRTPEPLGGLEEVSEAVPEGPDIDALRIALSKVSSVSREILRRRFWEGQKQADVAQALSMSPSWVGQLEKRALERLRQVL